MSEFKIIIDDGFVAYEFKTNIGVHYSIDNVVKEIHHTCSFELDEGKMITSYDDKEQINSLIEDKKQLLRVLKQLVVDYPELNEVLNEVIKKHS